MRPTEAEALKIWVINGKADARTLDPAGAKVLSWPGEDVYACGVDPECGEVICEDRLELDVQGRGVG